MALVAWSDICVPKTEGGLGVKQLASWNRAALCKYIWLICKKQQDLWVQWAQVVLLKGESIWKVKLPNDCSWSWKQILKMRTSIKDQVWVQIGDGRQTSLFYDLWLEGGRICDLVQVREELMAWGHGSVVAKWWNAGAWHMPDSFVRKYPSLAQLISSKSLQDREDKVVWRPTVAGGFSIASCYNLLRVKQPKVNWHRLVWSSGNFPLHSFILWLVVRGRLKTKVLLASRGMIIDLECCFCGRKPLSWTNEWRWILRHGRGRAIIKRKLRAALAASIYYIWQERNMRLFKDKSSTVDNINRRISYFLKLQF
ncbi:hypothetical protein SLEP1_g54437 [Rubroshorea leprosula]|uniref:Reverse transcriptase zinc-binding domain-containing protein n=1 Tax=Rubroshorea leprosula TaxID=152421 RepID=A0AAV5MCM2_9ROSI|nr:hypothetical protein SLEP1_g54437 [Rubroshorea leprosula]